VPLADPNDRTIEVRTTAFELQVVEPMDALVVGSVVVQATDERVESARRFQDPASLFEDGVQDLDGNVLEYRVAEVQIHALIRQSGGGRVARRAIDGMGPGKHVLQAGRVLDVSKAVVDDLRGQAERPRARLHLGTKDLEHSSRKAKTRVAREIVGSDALGSAEVKHRGGQGRPARSHLDDTRTSQRHVPCQSLQGGAQLRDSSRNVPFVTFSPQDVPDRLQAVVERLPEWEPG